MKKYYIIAGILTAVGLLGTLIGLALLPDIVPVHYNFAGEADRMGSKYEMLATPVIAILFCGVFLMMARFSKDTKDGRLQRKIFAVTGIFMLALFFGIGFWFMYLAGRADPGVPAVDAGALLKGCGVFLGLALIILGNFMPKARRNAFYGLRVPWTMDSEAVWQRSQRFAGIAAVVAGILTIVLSFVLPGQWAVVGVIVMPAVWVVLSLVMSWRYHKEA